MLTKRTNPLGAAPTSGEPAGRDPRSAFYRNAPGTGKRTVPSGGGRLGGMALVQDAGEDQEQDDPGDSGQPAADEKHGIGMHQVRSGAQALHDLAGKAFEELAQQGVA